MVPKLFEPLKFYCNKIFAYSINNTVLQSNVGKWTDSMPESPSYGYVPSSFMGIIVMKINTTTAIVGTENICLNIFYCQNSYTSPNNNSDFERSKTTPATFFRSLKVSGRLVVATHWLCGRLIVIFLEGWYWFPNVRTYHLTLFNQT